MGGQNLTACEVLRSVMAKCARANTQGPISHAQTSIKKKTTHPTVEHSI